MNVTRRKFLRAGAVSALFAGLTLAPSKLIYGQKNRKPATPDAPPDPFFSFNASTFTPYVGSEFLLAAGARGRATAARLERVSDFQQDMRERHAATHGGECFSLFLVPGPPRDGSVTYEAVINRLA